jgi:CRISPR-associated exonuclease Cas4
VEELVPISALQHYVYCPRQCALIHVEQVWEENLYTLRGQRLHQTVDVPDSALRDGLRVERALPLWSEKLGIVGRADVVEFLPDGTPYPVDYKTGPRRARRADEVQLCAQALCLEEMLGRAVPSGALYHHASRRRREVRFTAELRAEVEKVVAEVRELLGNDRLPAPAADSRCRDCSLVEACMPHALRGLPAWLEREWK